MGLEVKAKLLRFTPGKETPYSTVQESVCASEMPPRGRFETWTVYP